jgi:hypothetical protein
MPGWPVKTNAVERLVGRGLLLRHRNGVRQDLSLSAFAVNALK